MGRSMIPSHAKLSEAREFPGHTRVGRCTRMPWYPPCRRPSTNQYQLTHDVHILPCLYSEEKHLRYRAFDTRCRRSSGCVVSCGLWPLPRFMPACRPNFGLRVTCRFMSLAQSSLPAIPWHPLLRRRRFFNFALRWPRIISTGSLMPCTMLAIRIAPTMVST